MSTPASTPSLEEAWEHVLRSRERAESTDEDTARHAFLAHLHQIVSDWGQTSDLSTDERLSGVAFSICSLLDGSHLGFPGYALRARRSDEEGNALALGPDIAGCLHELFHTTR